MNPSRRRPGMFIAPHPGLRHSGRRLPHGLRQRVRSALRLLPLPFALAVALPAWAADEKPVSWALCPVEDAIPPFPGAPDPLPPKQQAKQRAERAQADTLISGDSQQGTQESMLYQGNVVMHHGDQFLNADNFRYTDQDQTSYVADGNVRYSDSGIRILAKRAEGNQDTDTHTITGIQYQLVDRRGNGSADSAHMVGPKGQLFASTYTTCNPQDPAWKRWQLNATRIDADTDEGFAVAHHATIRMGGIPILYAPWFKFPIDDRRQTGLLYPSIGYSSKNGLSWRQPIYLNLAPNYDATLEPRIMTNRGIVLGGEFRYLYHGGAGKLLGAWMPHDSLIADRERSYAEDDSDEYYDPLQAKNRGFLRFIGHHNLNATWQARANLAWISDSRYLEDNGGFSNGTGYAYTVLTSTVGVYGTSQFWTAGAESRYYELADYTLSKSSLPYNALPRVYFNYDRPLLDWLEVGMNGEVARFQHPTKDGGSRLDLKPFVSMPLRGAAWFFTPTLAYRYTAYQLDKDLADSLAGDRTPTRSLPIFSIDTGLFFDRDTSWGGIPFLQTLEPRLYYLYVPYRNQDDLPLFDTGTMTFSWAQLFRDNRFSSADRQTDANQLTLALSSRSIRQTDGVEKFNVSVGQIVYFDDQLVTRTSSESPVYKGKSAWVMDTNYMPNDRWTLGASYQYDAKKGQADLVSLRSRYLIGSDGVINLSYRYRRDKLKQADFSFLYPLTPSWSVVGRYYWSFQDRQLLEAIGGVQWDSCCLAVRIVARRYVHNKQGELDNAVQVEFLLKGLASMGQSTDRTLRRGILGYYRDDLYLVPPSVATQDEDEDDTTSDSVPF
ncbi:MAG: LPS assembly protein LptD [Pseudoxanthomonas sp.]